MDKRVSKIGHDHQKNTVIAPTLLNSWVNYGAGWQSAGYYKDVTGRVHLRGLIKSGALYPSALLLLPAGYRPAVSEIFNCISNNGSDLIARVDVISDGTVYVVSGGINFVSLSGVSFLAA